MASREGGLLLTTKLRVVAAYFARGSQVVDENRLDRKDIAVFTGPSVVRRDSTFRPIQHRESSLGDVAAWLRRGVENW